MSTLNDISEEIKNDPKNVPNNGNIHSVIQFILAIYFLLIRQAHSIADSGENDVLLNTA